MKLSSFIQDKYHYSDYQMKVLRYFFLSLFSEVSKFLLMGLVFFYFSQIPLYLWSVFLLWLLRFTSGGLHCRTYLGCLASSFIYLFLCIRILPGIHLPRIICLLLLMACMAAVQLTGPVPSVYRKHLTPSQLLCYRVYLLAILFFYFILMFIFPQNQFLITGFWVIMIHTLQLLVAHRK